MNAPPGHKQSADRIIVRFNPEWLSGTVLRGHRGDGAPRWFRCDVSWLWLPPLNELSPAELGAFLRLLHMLMRGANCRDVVEFETNRKELRLYGISDRILASVRTKCRNLEISLLADTGEIKELPTPATHDGTGRDMTKTLMAARSARALRRAVLALRPDASPREREDDSSCEPLASTTTEGSTFSCDADRRERASSMSHPSFTNRAAGCRESGRNDGNSNDDR